MPRDRPEAKSSVVARVRMSRDRLRLGVPLLLVVVGTALPVFAAVLVLARNPQSVSKEKTAMAPGKGIISIPSSRSVPETLDRVEAFLRSKGMTIFVRVDHAGEAKKVGLSLPPTQVLIFGNPKGGTLVMMAAPTAAIDLPLKALAWEDADGKVWLSYNDPAFLAGRFGLTDAQVAPLAGAGGLLEQALK
jgi:uncharacterized protein (DUF302 family)